MAACVNYNDKLIPAVLKPGTQALEHCWLKKKAIGSIPLCLSVEFALSVGFFHPTDYIDPRGQQAKQKQLWLSPYLGSSFHSTIIVVWQKRFFIFS